MERSVIFNGHKTKYCKTEIFGNEGTGFIYHTDEYVYSSFHRFIFTGVADDEYIFSRIQRFDQFNVSQLLFFLCSRYTVLGSYE